MALRAYYCADFATFLAETDEQILGRLAKRSEHALEHEQRGAWLAEITILKKALRPEGRGMLFLELQIPRMGKRADAVLLLDTAVVVLEFKVGASAYERAAFTQVEDYALDLKNFHEGSYGVAIVPVLVATNAPSRPSEDVILATDGVAQPIGTNGSDLAQVIALVDKNVNRHALDQQAWRSSGYRPTPTIVEAAEVLYRTHSVEEISRSDAGARNLRETSACVTRVIDEARRDRRKAICFITGVPGAGKTLAGMNIAMRRSEEHAEEHAVFLSGNGPLVDVLREALTRDQVRRDSSSRATAARKVRSFIQNIHHFRDHYLNGKECPNERVVVFDEAQRAWNREEASRFMLRKHGDIEFNVSEPEFLIEVMDRHTDWCVIVCLVGGGQEINTGEAGLSEWTSALERRFADWRVHAPPQVALPEYGASCSLDSLLRSARLVTEDHLHLAVSLRSFRSERVSEFVGHVVDGESEKARSLFQGMQADYPIYLTRDLALAREWLRRRARGTERFGLVASSGAVRLRPEGVHIKAAVDPADWFLNSRADVRSSFYLEEVATEFAVQGLELDWVGVCWDGNFYHDDAGWRFQAFRGTRWMNVNDASRRRYLKNAYRVLLTRARQGMVLFVPQGQQTDPTRPPAIYDGTFRFLTSCGLPNMKSADLDGGL